MGYLNPAAGAAREVYSSAGAPGAGTDEVQTITIDATGGTFRLAYGGWITGAIAWLAVNATLIAAIDAALEALPSIGTGGVVTAVGTMTAGVGTATVTFSGGNLSKRAVALITVAANNLTGTATLSVAETTPGVNADGRGAAKGSTLIRVDTGARYQNIGTPAAPNWQALV